MDEPFLEADVFLVSESAIGVEGGRVVGADVEHDLVARPQELGGHGAGHRGREATTTIVDMGQDVADDGQPSSRADHVGPGRGDQLAVDAQAVVDAVGDRGRRQPRREAELVEPVQLPDLDRQEPLDGRRVGTEARLVDPHPDHRRTRVDPVGGLDRGQHVRRRRDVGDPRPDQVAQDGGDAVLAAHREQRLRRRAAVLEHEGDRLVAVVGDPPAGARELALLEVADGVRGVQPVALEVGPQQALVGRRPGDDRAAPADRDGGHQSATAAGSAVASSTPVGSGWASAPGSVAGSSGGAAGRMARKPGIDAQRSRACLGGIAQAGLERTAQDALLGDDAGDQLGRRDVEGRVADVGPGRGDADAAELEDLVGGRAPRSRSPSRPRWRGRPSWSGRRRRTGSRAGRRARPAGTCRPCWRCRRWPRPGPRRPARRPPRRATSGARRPRRGAARAGRRPGPAPRSSAARPAGRVASRRPRRGPARPAWCAAWTMPRAVPYWPQASGPVLQWVRMRTGRSSGVGRISSPKPASRPWSVVASKTIASASARIARAIAKPSSVSSPTSV